MKILEKKYRGSVLCRTLGYPITYAIAKLLLDEGPLELDEIVTRVKRAKSTVCGHLDKLKLVNIVRFEKTRRSTLYWIKYPDEFKAFLNACEGLVKRTTERIDTDY
jgi:DNA-binding transcriptional regulator GbsR (MarR family)